MLLYPLVSGIWYPLSSSLHDCSPSDHKKDDTELPSLIHLIHSLVSIPTRPLTLDWRDGAASTSACLLFCLICLLSGSPSHILILLMCILLSNSIQHRLHLHPHNHNITCHCHHHWKRRGTSPSVQSSALACCIGSVLVGNPSAIAYPPARTRWIIILTSHRFGSHKMSWVSCKHHTNVSSFSWMQDPTFLASASVRRLWLQYKWPRHLWYNNDRCSNTTTAESLLIRNNNNHGIYDTTMAAGQMKQQ